MKTMSICVLLIFLLVGNIEFSKAGLTSDADAKAIMQKVDEKLTGKTSISDLTITIVRSDWSREMKVKSWTKGNDYSLILITAPARDRGTVYLKRDKEVWNWLPSVERTIKLPPSMMMQSWMGTDFNNDDLVRQSSIVEDYEHVMAGDSVIVGRACYKIRMIPKPEAAVVWEEVVSFIDKAEFIMLKTLYYDEDGYLVNIMNFSDIKDLGGKILPGKMEMIPVEKEGQRTIIEYNTLLFDTDIKDEFFTSQNMKRIRE